MLQLAKRIEAAWRRHGPVRFVRFAAYNIWYQLRLLRQCVPRPNDEDAFDEELGTDTAQIREIGSLDIDALSARHAVRYQASPAALVRTAISSLDADLSDMVFVDFGSGKGRVVMIAASFPFKAVIGVELSSELHQIAMENVRRAAPRLSNIQRISLRCSNAQDFELPPSNLVCYFYNPFGPAVLSPLVERLWSHGSQQGYRTFIIYVDPRHRTIFDNVGGFRPIIDDPQLLVLGT
jgi:hypothetical protein